MSCYRICQADLTCTCIHIYSDNVQKCDERLKVRQSHNPKANANVLYCYISLSCILVLGTYIYPCKYSCYPGFFLQVFVCYSAIFVLFKRGLIISLRQSTRLLSTYNVCCDQLAKSRRRRKKEKKIERTKTLHYFPPSLRETPSPSLSLSVPVHVPPLSQTQNTKPQWLCIRTASPPPPNHHTSTLPTSLPSTYPPPHQE